MCAFTACVRFLRRRGPAGLRDLFRFCRNCGSYALRSGPFRVCEARGGITTLSALYVLLKRRTTACQKGSFAVFCGRTAIIDSSGVKFDPTHNLENFKIILIFLITCGMVVLLEIKPLHRSYYVGKL